MTTRLHTQIIPIGDSQGVELPRLALEQSGLERHVTLDIEPDRIVIQPASRAGGKAGISDEIDSLFGEIRELMRRSADEAGLEEKIQADSIACTIFRTRRPTGWRCTFSRVGT